jgi:hypothetical protein
LVVEDKLSADGKPALLEKETGKNVWRTMIKQELK